VDKKLMDLVDRSGQEKWIEVVVLISGGEKLADLEKQYFYMSPLSQ
jgi:hypothetical protein